MSEPVERELMPGVFITDFRTPATVAANAAHTGASVSASGSVSGSTTAASREEHESKTKEQAEADDTDDTDVSMSGSGGGVGATSSVAARTTSSVPPTRPSNSAYPADIPSDVEELELQLAALETNLVQLIKSNEVLQEELKLTPDDQDYLDAVEENRVTILARSDRIQAIQRQLHQLAPHRAEERSQAATHALQDAQQQAQQQQQQQPQAAPDTEEGLFL